VSLGDLTKQLAKEAIGAQVDEMVGSLRGPDSAQKPDAPPAIDALANVIMGQVQAMQNALKEDQELLVQCAAGRDTVRVLEMFAPSPRLLVLTGLDSERAITRVVVPAETVQLVCKPVAVKEGNNATRLRFVLPKTK
jgi:hypothetical protein